MQNSVCGVEQKCTMHYIIIGQYVLENVEVLRNQLLYNILSISGTIDPLFSKDKR